MLKIFISYGHDTESCSSILLYGLLFTLSTCDHVQNFQNTWCQIPESKSCVSLYR